MKLFERFKSPISGSGSTTDASVVKDILVHSHFGMPPKEIEDDISRMNDINRIRYARAVAAERGFGSQFNLYHEDHQLISFRKNQKVIPYSLTQIRCDPDQTILVKDGMERRDDTPTKYQITVRELGTKLNETVEYSRDELEALVKRHPLHAGTKEERLLELASRVQQMDLKTLYQRYRELRRYEGGRTHKFSSFEQYGRNDIDHRVNCELEVGLIHDRLALNLDKLVRHAAMADTPLFKKWLQEELANVHSQESSWKTSYVSRILRKLAVKQLERADTPEKLVNCAEKIIARAFRFDNSQYVRLADRLLSSVPSAVSAQL